MVLGILGTICIGPFYAVIPYLIFRTQRGLLRIYVIQIDKDRDTLVLRTPPFLTKSIKPLNTNCPKSRR
jgi:hypothetical protein